MPPGRRRIARDIDMLAAGQRELHAHGESIAPLVAVLGPDDYHACGGDAASS
jgi:hypothetical protein